MLKSNLTQEAGDEEKKEVSVTLRQLRIKSDNMSKLVRERERELEELKVRFKFLTHIEKT